MVNRQKQERESGPVTRAQDLQLLPGCGNQFHSRPIRSIVKLSRVRLRILS